MVKALHSAGIEVILDVVYNHTAEGNHMGPMLSMRGIDNLAYYRVIDDDPRYYIDFTGTGNSLNMRHPHVLQLIMDSLRYWVTEMHVDGFRFDLASTLARELYAVDRLSAFFDLVQQDPVVSQVKLIAEPWDVGEGGYQVGNFPPLWSEWNGRYRDTIRDFWRGEPATLAEFGYALHRQLRPVPGRHPPADGIDQLRHRPRRLHAARPRVLQRQAQRGQRRGQPRRRVAQPLVELRRRGRRPTTRRSSPCAPGSGATCRHAAAVAGRADAARRRRARAHPAGQQQRLLPGQRDLVVRLGRRRRRRSTEWCRQADRTCAATTRCSVAAAGSRVARSAASRTSLWFRSDGEEMSDDDWETGYAKSSACFLNGEHDHHHRHLRWPDRRRQLLRDVQRQRARPAVELPGGAVVAAVDGRARQRRSRSSPAPSSPPTPRSSSRSFDGRRSPCCARRHRPPGTPT